MNDLQLAQETLNKKYDDVRAWEDPDRQEEAFQRLYESHIQELQDAKQHATSLEDWNNKIRALGNHPKDLALISDKFPHFEDKGVSPEATGDLPHGAYSSIIQSTIPLVLRTQILFKILRTFRLLMEPLLLSLWEEIACLELWTMYTLLLKEPMLKRL